MYYRILNLVSSNSNLYPMFLVLLLPIFFIVLFNVASIIFKKRLSLPPGPTPWPIIGNIHQLEKKLHISMTKFAKIYGPLISLRLGTQVVIVASSPSAAAEILKNHDRVLSARFLPKCIPRRCEELERISFTFNPNCSDQWKFMRSLTRTELFSPKAIESQAKLREKKLKEMIEYLNTKEGEVVNIGEVVFSTSFNTLSNLLFSKDLVGFEDGGKAKSTIWRISEILSSLNIAEFYPMLEALDLQGLKRRASECVKEMFGVWESDIKERRERSVNGDKNIGDFLDVFLANGFDDDHINWLVMEILSAGSDSTMTTVEWAVTELCKNKHAMKTLKEELNRGIDGRKIDDSLISRFPYLNACIKETFRLHPAAPFLLPHRAPETCKIMNYTIPKDAQLLVNVWAIGRDSSIWEDPLSFKPERFFETNINYMGHDFELIPFGSGRRICPGLPMAAKQLPLILGYLIHCFDWSLPNCEDPNSLDTGEKFGVTLQKEKPLQLIPRSKF